MAELRKTRAENSPKTSSPYERAENQNVKNLGRKEKEEKVMRMPQPFTPYDEKSEGYRRERASDEYMYSSPRASSNSKDYSRDREDEYSYSPYERQGTGGRTMSLHGPLLLQEREDESGYAPPFPGRQFRSNSVSGASLLSIGQEMERDGHMEKAQREGSGNITPNPGDHGLPREKRGGVNVVPNILLFRNEEGLGESGDSEDGAGRGCKGRKKIKMEFIKDKGRRGVTFSKRKKGIMKKAYELNVLTKCEILLVVASETGHVYTFATPKLQPIIKQHEGLIQQYLNGPSPTFGEVSKMYEASEHFPSKNTGYYKDTDDTYSYDEIMRGHGYPPGYYQGGGYDTDNSPRGGMPRM